MDSNHRSPGCEPDVVAAGPRDQFVSPAVDPSGVAPESPVCRTGVFLLDHEPEWGMTNDEARMTNGVAGACSFRHSDFVIRHSAVAGAGIEPAPPGSEPGVAASSNHPASPVSSEDTRFDPKFADCGGRNRTCGLVVQSHGFLPAETTPQNWSVDRGQLSVVQASQDVCCSYN